MTDEISLHPNRDWVYVPDAYQKKIWKWILNGPFDGTFDSISECRWTHRLMMKTILGFGSLSMDDLKRLFRCWVYYKDSPLIRDKETRDLIEPFAMLVPERERVYSAEDLYWDGWPEQARIDHTKRIVKNERARLRRAAKRNLK